MRGVNLIERDVYLAGSSQDTERVLEWRDRLQNLGIRAQAPWVEVIAEVGKSNPRNVVRSDRSRWALGDLREIGRSEILWLFRPPDGFSSHGGYFELGYASGQGQITVVSGARKSPSIFDALVNAEFARDGDAFKWICRFFGEMKEGVM